MARKIKSKPFSEINVTPFVDVMLVLLIVSYIIGDSEPVLNAQGKVLQGGELGAASNQWVGSLIWYSTILVIIGGAFFVVDLVKGLVKS